MDTLKNLKKEEQEILKEIQEKGHHLSMCKLYMPRGINVLIPMSDDDCTCGLAEIRKK